MADAFPHREALCESCGYPLMGVASDGVCPECGAAVADSHPCWRTGPAWEARRSPRTALRTALAIALHPRRTFRRMRVDGVNGPARAFLALVAGAVAVGWCALELILLVQVNPPRALGAVALLVIACSVLVAVSGFIALLTYIEALGVTYFSGRRGWRVPWRLAERVVCYASVGWVPAALVLAKARVLEVSGALDRWLYRLMGVPVPDYALAVMALVFAGAILGFEVLVWVGVRQVRYGNGPASGAGAARAGDAGDAVEAAEAAQGAGGAEDEPGGGAEPVVRS